MDQPSDVIFTVSLTIGGVLVGALAAIWFKSRQERNGKKPPTEGGK